MVNNTNTRITTLRWANMHGHLRQSKGEDELMSDIMPFVFPHYYYYTAMPNTKPPKRTGYDCLKYKEEIMDFVPEEYADLFHPITPLKMLWDKQFKTTPQVVAKAHSMGINWVKIYFRGTTTNSDDGVLLGELQQLFPTLEKMEELGMVLLIHGEVPGSEIDMKEREFLFANKYLTNLSRLFPKLRIVMEHITDARTVEIIKQLPDTVAATIATHHLYMTQNDYLELGPRPRNACKPYAKFFVDLNALIEAALSGNPKFFFGDDNAWHRKYKKFCEVGACGCAHTHSVEFVTQLFADYKKLDKLEDFACTFGPQFYGLPLPTGTITLEFTEEEYFPSSEVTGVLIWGFDRKLRWRVTR